MIILHHTVIIHHHHQVADHSLPCLLPLPLPEPVTVKYSHVSDDIDIVEKNSCELLSPDERGLARLPGPEEQHLVLLAGLPLVSPHVRLNILQTICPFVHQLFLSIFCSEHLI